MKKYLFVAVIFWAIYVFTSHVLAQGQEQQPLEMQKTVVCFPTKQVIEGLTKKFKEEPILIGQSEEVEGVTVGVFFNPKVGSFTIIEFNESTACIVSSGSKAKFRYPGTKSI